jgi:hypothetical protein
LDNSKYIFEYFENKKNISSGNTQQSSGTNKYKIMNSFFKITTEDEPVLQIENNNERYQYYFSFF